MDFRGQYTIKTVVSQREIWAAEDMGKPAPSDKPCFKITGPGEFEAVVWNALNRSPEKVLDDFLMDLFPARKIWLDTVKATVKFDYETL